MKTGKFRSGPKMFRDIYPRRPSSVKKETLISKMSLDAELGITLFTAKTIYLSTQLFFLH